MACSAPATPHRVPWVINLLWPALLICVVAAHGQSTEREIKDRLLKKPLYLRGCWGAEHLQFDAQGKPLKQYPAIAFALSGIRIGYVHLKDGRLKLEGERIGLEFDPAGKMSRVPLEAPDPMEVNLEIQAPANGDFTPALDAIFAPDLADVPQAAEGSYWAEFAPGRWLPGELDAKLDVKEKPDPSVTPPRVLAEANPSFSALAHAMKYSGIVKIRMRVDTDGSVTNLRIQQAAGLGLDERALAAVEHYRFAPATKNSIPVAVPVYVVVNFEIF